MIHHHKWGTYGDLEDMIPFERDIYKAMLINHIKEENERTREEIQRNKEAMARITSTMKRRR